MGEAQYHLGYQVQKTPDNKWLVSGTVEQSGVPDGWKDVIPVYAKINGKTIRLGLVGVTQKTTSLKFTLPVQPEKISLNDDDEMLVEIK